MKYHIIYDYDYDVHGRVTLIVRAHVDSHTRNQIKLARQFGYIKKTKDTYHWVVLADLLNFDL